jgi:hypothetical protein
MIAELSSKPAFCSVENMPPLRGSNFRNRHVFYKDVGLLGLVMLLEVELHRSGIFVEIIVSMIPKAT